MSTLVVVDGHNVYNDACRFLATLPGTTAAEGVRQQYFREWFDTDRLINATLDPNMGLDPWRDLGIVIFRSKGCLGGKGKDGLVALDDPATQAFWARQGAAPNTSTMLVEVPGLPAGKDRSVDISIVVYLFETADKWESAVLFTQDGDFAPAVWSLRRRGKRFYCSLPSRSLGTPLIQACQSFIPWDPLFLRIDRSLFECLVPGGALDQFLAHPIATRPNVNTVVRLNGTSLLIEPGFPGGGDNVFNEILRTCGHLELRAKESGGGSRLDLNMYSPDRQNQGYPRADFVIEGLRRHAECFEGSRWWTHFDVSSLQSA